jgi:hypothetical protein
MFDVANPSPTSQGSPSYEILIGSKLDTYTTGTISGTINTSTLTGVGTLWTTVEGLGKGSKITIGSYVYTVKSITSDTVLVIYEVLIEAVAALTTYIISLDNLIIQLYNIPDSAENIYFRYRRIVAPLYNDQDIPDMPDKWHWILVTAGLIWAWATKDKDESIRQKAVFEQGIQLFWLKNMNISQNRVYPKVSWDYYETKHFPWGGDYGVVIPR